MPEIDGDLYVLRLWTFFGDREYGVKIWSRDPIVKSGNLIRFEYIDDVPEALRAVRMKFHYDFGKFDHVLVNGEVILLDINKTPMIGSASDEPEPMIPDMAQGIHAYFRAAE